MVSVRFGALLTLLAVGAPVTAQTTARPPSTLAVVANTAVPEDSLTTAEVRRIYLRRQRFWRDGTAVAPVNLPATSPIRLAFSRAVLGRAPRDLVEFWNDLYFHGIQPPPVLDSERAVLLYVARTPGGLGYVTRDALPPANERSGYRVVLEISR